MVLIIMIIIGNLQSAFGKLKRFRKQWGGGGGGGGKRLNARVAIKSERESSRFVQQKSYYWSKILFEEVSFEASFEGRDGEQKERNSRFGQQRHWTLGLFLIKVMLGIKPSYNGMVPYQGDVRH